MSSTEALPPATPQEQVPRRAEDAATGAGSPPAGEERQPFVLNVRGFLEVVGVTGPTLTISSVSPQAKQYAGQPRVTPPPRKAISGTTAAAAKAPSAAKAPAATGTVSRTAAAGVKSSPTATAKTPATSTAGKLVAAAPRTAAPGAGEGESKESGTTVRFEQMGAKAAGGTAKRGVSEQPPGGKVTATEESTTTAKPTEKATAPKVQPKLVKKSLPTLPAKAASAMPGEKTEGEKTEGEKTEGEKTEGEKTEGEKTEREPAAAPKAQLRLVKKAAPATLPKAAGAEEEERKKELETEGDVVKEKGPKEVSKSPAKKDERAAHEAAAAPAREEEKTEKARLPEGVRKAALEKKAAAAATKVGAAAPKSEQEREDGDKPRPKAAPVFPAVKGLGKAAATPAGKAKAAEGKAATKEPAEAPTTDEKEKLEESAEQVEARKDETKEEKDTKAVAGKRSPPGAALSTKEEKAASKIAAAAKAAKGALAKAGEKAIPPAKTGTKASTKDLSEAHAATATEGKTTEIGTLPAVVAATPAIKKEQKEGEATIAPKEEQKKKPAAKAPATKKSAVAAVEAKAGEAKPAKPGAAPKRVAANKTALAGVTATTPGTKKAKAPAAKKEKAEEGKSTGKPAGPAEKRVKSLKKKGGGSSTSTSGSEGSKVGKKITRARVGDKEAAEKPAKTAAPKRKAVRKKGETAKAGATATKKTVPNLRKKASLKGRKGSLTKEPKAEKHPEAVDAVREEGAAAVVKMEIVKPTAEQKEREEKRQQKQEEMLNQRTQQEIQEEAPKLQQQPDVEKSLLQKGHSGRLERQHTEEKPQRKQQEETLSEQQQEKALQRLEEEKLQQQREGVALQQEGKPQSQQWEHISEPQQPRDALGKHGSAKEAEAARAVEPIGAELQRKQTKEALEEEKFFAGAPSVKELPESMKEPEKTKEELGKEVDEKLPQKMEDTQAPEKETSYSKFPYPSWCSRPPPVPSYHLRSKPWPSRDILVQRMSPSAQRLMEEHTAMMLQRANVWLPPRKRDTAAADLPSLANCVNNSKALHYLRLCCCCQSCQPDLLPERHTSLQDPLGKGARPAAAAAAQPSKGRAKHIQSHSAELQLALKTRPLPEQQQASELQTRKSAGMHRQQDGAPVTELFPHRSVESKQADLETWSSAPQGHTDEDERGLLTSEQHPDAVEPSRSAAGSPQIAAETQSQAYPDGQQQALQGYYDEKGNWVQGYYDETGNWVQGYYDTTGRWVQGYYDETGKWVQGYYDETGQWVCLPAVQQTQ